MTVIWALQLRLHKYSSDINSYVAGVKVYWIKIRNTNFVVCRRFCQSAYLGSVERSDEHNLKKITRIASIFLPLPFNTLICSLFQSVNQLSFRRQKVFMASTCPTVQHKNTTRKHATTASAYRILETKAGPDLLLTVKNEEGARRTTLSYA